MPETKTSNSELVAIAYTSLLGVAVVAVIATKSLLVLVGSVIGAVAITKLFIRELKTNDGGE